MIRPRLSACPTCGSGSGRWRSSVTGYRVRRRRAYAHPGLGYWHADRRQTGRRPIRLNRRYLRTTTVRRRGQHLPWYGGNPNVGFYAACPDPWHHRTGPVNAPTRREVPTRTHDPERARRRARRHRTAQGKDRR